MMSYHQVAPPVGAWIETCIKAYTNTDIGSRPPWARGLKHRKRLLQLGIDVAPPVGAWIETRYGRIDNLFGCRAPRGRVD